MNPSSTGLFLTQGTAVWCFLVARLAFWVKAKA